MGRKKKYFEKITNLSLNFLDKIIKNSVDRGRPGLALETKNICQELKIEDCSKKMVIHCYLLVLARKNTPIQYFGLIVEEIYLYQNCLQRMR